LLWGLDAKEDKDNSATACKSWYVTAVRQFSEAPDLLSSLSLVWSRNEQN
jgi:hypothetical protein